MKHKPLPRKLGLTGLALLGYTAGCATSHPNRHDPVCARCQTIQLERLPHADSPDKAVAGVWADIDLPRWGHFCPGCQGALTTLFKESQAPAPMFRLRGRSVLLFRELSLTINGRTNCRSASRPFALQPDVEL